ncbi:MAG TPA: hypothetical protein VGZ00_06920 [Candidatus Baltobacteraceae bacterium]|jgi:hypothetical protein|nr:hypothetical protein [Candidatus Baltobacteraceae bacterium]
MKNFSETSGIDSAHDMALVRTEAINSTVDALNASTDGSVIGFVSGALAGAATAIGIGDSVAATRGNPPNNPEIIIEACLILAALALYYSAQKKWREAWGLGRKVLDLVTQLSPKDQIHANLTVVEHPESGEYVLRFDKIEQQEFFNIGDTLRAKLNKSIANPETAASGLKRLVPTITSSNLPDAARHAF